MKKQKRWMCFFLSVMLLCGCKKVEKTEEYEETSYQILEEEEIPEKMREKIERIKKNPFQITFEEEGLLYIGQGYGEKSMNGYEITIDRCDMSEHFVYFHSTLYGPKKAGEIEKTYPYIVVSIKCVSKYVIFLSESGG